MGSTVSRHKRYFLPSTVKIVSKYFKSQAFSVDIHEMPAPEESLNWRNQFSCSQKDCF